MYWTCRKMNVIFLSFFQDERINEIPQVMFIKCFFVLVDYTLYPICRYPKRVYKISQYPTITSSIHNRKS